MSAERLQKTLASAGLGSRRACEEIILEGRVSVNGQVRDSLPVLVDPQADDIRVDGRKIVAERPAYVLLNKPRGVLCTNYDPSGRAVVADLIADIPERLFPVGRLDLHTSGLLLMTNDGDLAARLTHPRYRVAKTYLAQVEGSVSPASIDKLKKGVWLSDGKAVASQVKIARKGGDATLLEITQLSGRDEHIRRALAKIGHKMRRLTRVKLGPLTLEGVTEGRFRTLTGAEVDALRRSAAKADASGARSRSTDGARRKSPAKGDRRQGEKSPPAKKRSTEKRSTEKRTSARPAPRQSGASELPVIRRGGVADQSPSKRPPRRSKRDR